MTRPTSATRVTSERVLERYFDALRAHDWPDLASCLAEDVHRTGPFRDVVHGRDSYVDFLAKVMPALPNYALEVHEVRALADGSALVLLSEWLDREGIQTRYREALLFEFDDAGLIERVDIYIKPPPRDAS